MKTNLIATVEISVDSFDFNDMDRLPVTHYEPDSFLDLREFQKRV